MDTQKRAESREQVWEMCFKTYRDKKSCLSSEIEVLQVEKVAKIHDFLRISMGIPYVIYIGNLLKNRDLQLVRPLSPSSDNIFHHGLF